MYSTVNFLVNDTFKSQQVAVCFGRKNFQGPFDPVFSLKPSFISFLSFVMTMNISGPHMYYTRISKTLHYSLIVIEQL